jgi:hypothetical protein
MSHPTAKTALTNNAMKINQLDCHFSLMNEEGTTASQKR